MLVFPYSTALTLARPTYVSYGAVLLCAVVYTLQQSLPITFVLWYRPESWNPLTMISAVLLHMNFLHLLGNAIFFLAFAPALEVLIDNWLRFVGFMVAVALTSQIAYSLTIAAGLAPPAPTLGFSGVVMGMMGLSAYLMPKARIRVFLWLILLWKTFFVPAWILALIYIGLDTWMLLVSGQAGGVNLVGHVAGGVAGYVFGRLHFRDRLEETRDALADEIEIMRIEQQRGKTQAEAHRYRKAVDPLLAERERRRDEDRFMGEIYRLVRAHRSGEAVVALSTRFDEESLHTELEPLFERMRDWGPSRPLLCVGRLWIALLDRERRYGRALMAIEQCQAISADFVLPEVARTLFYAEMALDTGKPEIARRLLDRADSRYPGLVHAQQARHLYERARRA